MLWASFYESPTHTDLQGPGRQYSITGPTHGPCPVPPIPPHNSSLTPAFLEGRKTIEDVEKHREKQKSFSSLPSPSSPCSITIMKTVGMGWHFEHLLHSGQYIPMQDLMEKPPSPASSWLPTPLLAPRAVIPSLSLQPNTRAWPGQARTVLTGKNNSTTDWRQCADWKS